MWLQIHAAEESRNTTKNERWQRGGRGGRAKLVAFNLTAQRVLRASVQIFKVGFVSFFFFFTFSPLFFFFSPQPPSRHPIRSHSYLLSFNRFFDLPFCKITLFPGFNAAAAVQLPTPLPCNQLLQWACLEQTFISSLSKKKKILTQHKSY